MSIYLPESLPNPSALNFSLVSNVQRFQSTFTRSVQAVELLGTHWQFSATWDFISREQVPAMKAFLANLRGGVETLFFADLPNINHGDAAGVFNITGFTGLNSITCSTTLSDGVIAFLAGDHIEIPMAGGFPNEYKMVTSDATAQSGSITLFLTPTFRHVPDVGQPIVYLQPHGLFQSVDPVAGLPVFAPNNGGPVTINCQEWIV